VVQAARLLFSFTTEEQRAVCTTSFSSPPLYIVALLASGRSAPLRDSALFRESALDPHVA
jgi:hypothetical protein